MAAGSTSPKWVALSPMGDVRIRQSANGASISVCGIHPTRAGRGFAATLGMHSRRQVAPEGARIDGAPTAHVHSPRWIAAGSSSPKVGSRSHRWVTFVFDKARKAPREETPLSSPHPRGDPPQEADSASASTLQTVPELPGASAACASNMSPTDPKHDCRPPTRSRSSEIRVPADPMPAAPAPEIRPKSAPRSRNPPPPHPGPTSNQSGLSLESRARTPPNPGKPESPNPRTPEPPNPRTLEPEASSR
jgi:hypothetical protein